MTVHLRRTLAGAAALAGVLASAPPARAADFVEPAGSPQPAPVAQPAPVLVAQPAPVVPAQRPHQGLVTLVQGAGGLGVAGSAGAYGSFGGGLIVSGGWELDFGATLRAEVGYRGLGIAGFQDPQFASGRRPDMHSGDFFFGGGLRYTLLREVAIHPWVEAMVDYHFTFIYVQDARRAAANSTTLGGALAAGLEYDLNENWSLELGLRFDYVFNNEMWRQFTSSSRFAPDTRPSSAGSDGTLWLLLGVSFNR